MRSRIKRISRKFSAAVITIGLTIGMPMLSLHPMPSALAQTMDIRPDSTSVLQGKEAIEQLKVPGLSDSLQKAVEATRYDIRLDERPSKGLLSPANRAPKPAQQFDSYITTGSSRLVPSKAIHKGIESGSI